MKMVNIACGNIFDNNWINIDFVASSKEIIQHNVLRDLPFEDNSVDVIYCSHFVEHVFKDQVGDFIFLCYSKLKPGGIIRIVVPDLENICREYISVCENEPESFKHEWLTIELIDQIARNVSGGYMGKIYKDTKLPEPYLKYIHERVGEDLKNEKSETSSKTITIDKIKVKLLYYWIAIIRNLIPKYIRDQVFSNTQIGENHRWMYDKYSLKKLLNKAGFAIIQSFNFLESNIPNFNSYYLDIKKDGSPRKGNSSLYIEGIKPK